MTNKIVFKGLKYIFLGLVGSTVVVSIIGVLVLLYFSQGLPRLISVDDYKPFIVTKVIGKGDVVVGEFFKERRYVVPLDQIPDMVQRAFISAEDDRFYDHQGIDLQGILRAAIANAKAGRVVQGGSTITQQVAKSLLLTPERSFVRKAKEVILANRMEKNLGKKQILFLYLNQIYLGQGAYGVEAAARVYFNKSAKDLTLPEAAILAGLPQAPSKYSPVVSPKHAKERQQYVLRRMKDDGVISESEMEKALKESVRVYLSIDPRVRDVNEKYAPYYVEHVRKYLLEKYGKDALYQEGLVVHTPVDPHLSVVAMNAIQEGLRATDKRQGYRGPIAKNRTSAEISQAISEVAENNFLKKYPFKVIRPDGQEERDPRARIAALRSELDLFEEGNLYEGVVTEVNDGKKEVSVNLGLLKGTIGIDQMRWAQPVKAPSSTGIELISRPSQALQKGDQILVKLLTKNGKGGGVELALEQIPMVQGALLSMDVNTGEVYSLVGGYDYRESEFNRAIQAERQPGSTYKPIIYSAAVDKGYTPVTIIQDSPIVFNAGENEKWKPENFEEKFYGDTLFRSALIRSRNIPTIKIVQDIQVNYLVDYSLRLGLPDKFNRDLSISLGSSTVSLLELSRVYSIFPRGGRRIKPIFINTVLDRYGKVLEQTIPVPAQPPTNLVLPSPPRPVNVAGELQTEINSGQTDLNRGVWNPDPADPDRVMDPRTAYVMTHLMNEVATVGTGAGAKALGRSAAGKTGTTNDYLDAWFMGFTPSIVTGVWIGFDTQKTIAPKATGAQIALPVWLEYMKEAVKGTPDVEFSVPKGVTFSFIDSRTGKLVNANKPNAVREAFIEGTEPGGRASSVAASPIQNGKPGATGRSRSRKTNNEEQDDFFKEDIQ